MDSRKLAREDIIYFKSPIPVDGEIEHHAYAWWFYDYCIKLDSLETYKIKKNIEKG
jgi:hypothetical protein